MVTEALDILGSGVSDEIPEIKWYYGDDLCDCPLQNIGWRTNPYTARTFKIRLCCLYEELGKMFPHLVQSIPAFEDYRNNDELLTEPLRWNSEDADMPRYLWYRQLMAITGLPMAEVRRLYADKEPPKRVPEGMGVRLTEAWENLGQPDSR